ncbi:hypothetical protein SOVF_025410 [Spinacia oleracea]|nr:hypothetical protein SOVF_025410 [Spinacia oleracea]
MTSPVVFRAGNNFCGGLSSREPLVRRRGNRPLLEYHRQRARPSGDDNWRESPATGETQGKLREEEGSTERGICISKLVLRFEMKCLV